jgi:glycosyltransferase 2 family protein
MVGLVRAIAARRWLVVVLQTTAAAAVLAVLAYFVRDAWGNASDRIADASLLDLAISLIWLAAYYLLFVVGWIWILAAWGIRLRYRDALQAEMVSMLAKYIPGGVWTPAARVVAVRRAGVTNTPLVLSSILLEAGLSAVAGVLVFLVGLATVDSDDADLIPLLVFGVVVSVALHPRVFQRLTRLIFRPFKGEPPPPLPYRTMLGLIGYYAFTWIVGGAALYFLLRSVGGAPSPTEVVFLGGASAVGAIVAVLVVIAPSGLGVREASMYGLMLAVTSSGAALGATVLNRVAITGVEAGLLLAGMLAWRLRVGEVQAPERLPEGEAPART